MTTRRDILAGLGGLSLTPAMPSLARAADVCATRKFWTLIGKYPHTNALYEGKVKSPCVTLDIAPVRTLRIAAGYTYVDADAALRRPAHSGFARASWRPARGSLDVDVRKVGVRADNDFSSLSPSLLESGGEWVWNAAASVRLGARVEAVGRVENAFDRQYMEPLGYPAWRRTAHIGLSVKF